MKVHDNFGFIKSIDNKCYQHIHSAEKSARTEIDDSAYSFRKALERVMKRICKENDIVLYGEGKKLYNMIDTLKSKNLLPSIVFNKRVKCYGGEKKCYDDAYDFMRTVGNSGSHDSDSIKEKQGKIKLNIETMVIALKLFQEMMFKIHHLEDMEEFDESKMYIEDYAVYEAEDIPEWDKSGCVRQYRACKVDEEGDISQYAIIRQYNQKTSKSLLLRNKKLYTEATKMSEKTMPDGLTQMDEITPYNNDNAFYIIAYTFAIEPKKLSSVLSELDYNERQELCKKIITIFKDLHSYDSPIYHRLLNPDCVYVCKKGKSYLPYIVNFSYAKINSSNLTVKEKIPDAKEAKSYGIYIKYLAPEYDKYDSENEISNEIWEKIDLYALGVLAADILIGKITTKVVRYDDLLDADVPDDIAETVSLLHSEDPEDRMGLDQVLEVM